MAHRIHYLPVFGRGAYCLGSPVLIRGLFYFCDFRLFYVCTPQLWTGPRVRGDLCS